MWHTRVNQKLVDFGIDIPAMWTTFINEVLENEDSRYPVQVLVRKSELKAIEDEANRILLLLASKHQSSPAVKKRSLASATQIRELAIKAQDGQHYH